MPNYQVISREKHGSKRWLRTAGYAFAAQEALVPLVAFELTKATMSLPIAFTFSPHNESYVPSAVLSLQPGNDWFVAKSGSWAGDYIPAALRAYPFRLARTEDGQVLLTIDEDSGALSDRADANRFFDDSGQPDKMLVDVLNFLKTIEHSQAATLAACAVLQKHQLIQPWPVTCKTEAGDKPVEGLFRIDEAALGKLPGEVLQELAEAGALMVAYCQLLSMQHLPLLGQLAEAHAKAAAQAAQKPAPAEDLNLAFLSKNGTINFGGLK